MILQIIGYKNVGKTTLMTHAISFLKEQNFKVASIKHHGHQGEDIQLQHQPVDHMKHFQSGADQSIVQGHDYRQTVTRTTEQSLSNIIKESVTIDCDVVLVEGFKHENYDKIIVYDNEKQLHELNHLNNICYRIKLNEPNAYQKFDEWLINKVTHKD